MKQDKYTIIGLIIVILVLGVILGIRVLMRQTNLSLKIISEDNLSTSNQNMNFDKYIGENLTYTDIQNMLSEIEVYVIGATKIPLNDRTVITLNLTTNKSAGALTDYSNTIRGFKQGVITENHTYKVTLKSGLTETTKTMEIIIL